MDIRFQLLLGKYQGTRFLEPMVKYVWFAKKAQKVFQRGWHLALLQGIPVATVFGTASI